MSDLRDCARAWAKVQAYLRCGKREEARRWWSELERLVWGEVRP